MKQASRLAAFSVALFSLISSATAQQWSASASYDVPAANITHVMAANLDGTDSPGVGLIDDAGFQFVHGHGLAWKLDAPVTLVPGAVNAVVAPFDGGKYDDIVALTDANGGQPASLQLISNLGDLKFATPTPIAVPKISLSASCALATADMDENGTPDLLLACPQNNGTIEVGLNQGDGSFQFQSLPLMPGREIETIQTGDFNGDGYVDLLLKLKSQNDDADSYVLLLGTGKMQFGVATQLPKDMSGKTLTATDYNGDTISDLLASTDSSVSTWRGQYDKTAFLPDATIPSSDACSIVAITSAPLQSYVWGVHAGDLVAAEKCDGTVSGSSWKLARYINEDAVQIQVTPTWKFKEAKYLTQLNISVVPLHNSAIPTGSLILSTGAGNKPTSLPLVDGKATIKLQLGKGKNYVSIAYPGDENSAAAGQVNTFIIPDLDKSDLPPPLQKSGSVVPAILMNRGRLRPHLLSAVYYPAFAARLVAAATTSGGQSCTQVTSQQSCPVSDAGTYESESEATVTASPSTSVAYGSSVTLTSTVTTGSGNASLLPRYNTDQPCLDSSQGANCSTVALIDGSAYGSTPTVTQNDSSVSCGHGCFAPVWDDAISWSTSSLSPGTHTFEFQFTDDIYGTWTTPPLTITITGGKTATTTNVSCSPATFTYGSSSGSTCTASVSGNSPTGTVTFYFSGGGVWTTASLSGGSASVTGWNTDNPPMSTGVYAVYNGDTSNNSSTSNTTTVTITKATPTVSVSCSNPTTPSNTSCNVSVTGVSGAAVPSGSVSFTDDGGYWGSTTLSNGSTTGTGSAATGSHTMSVTYSGDGNYNSASATTTWTENKATPSLNISCSPASAVYGSVNVNCSPALSGGSSPTGSISWGWTSSGACTPGSWTTGQGLTTPVGNWAGYGAGNYTVCAQYTGDSNNNSSNIATTTFVINKATPTVSASCSPNPVTTHSNYSCSASVSGGATGTVTFPSQLGGQTVTLSSGSASTSTENATAPPGNYGGTVTYSGDSNNNSATANLTLSVTKISSSLSVNAGTLIEQWQADALDHNTGGGSASGSFWVAAPGDSTSCCAFQYGPYVSNLLPGAVNIATWSLAIDNNTSDNNPVAYVDVFDDATGAVVASETITRQQFTQANTFQTFSLPFTASNPAYEYEIRVNYLGDSATLTEAYAQISGQSAKSTYGQPVTLVSMIPEVNGIVPTGTVTFYSGGNAIGTASVSASTGSAASATLTVTNLPVGSDAITATYSGDANYAGSTSSTVTQTISAATTTQLSSSVNPTNAGQSTTLTALISTGGNAPTGSVSYGYNGTTMGSANISSTSATNLLPYSNQIAEPGTPWSGYCGGYMSNVTADAPDIAAPDGTYTATKLAMPSSDPCDSAARMPYGLIEGVPAGLVAGNSYTISVWLKGLNGGEHVTVGLNDCASQSATLTNQWQRYSFTFSNIPASTASCYNGSRGFEIEGQINGTDTWYIWGAQVEQSSSPGPYIVTSSSSASGSGGTASLPYSGLPAGTDTVTGSYGGDSSDAASSGSLIQTVNTVTPTVSITSSSNPSAYGQSVTFSCSASAGGNNVLDSTTATFSVDGTSEFTTTTTGGLATWATSTLSIGTHTVACSISGAGYTTTSSSVSQVVGLGNPAVTVQSNSNPATFGAAVTLKATVSSPGTALSPTGSVQFEVNGSPYGSAVALTSGSASIAAPTLPGGTSTITAVYSGDSNFNSITSSPYSQVITPIAEPVTLTASANPSGAGESVQFEAFVTVANSSGAAPATGTMQFQVDGTVIGTVPVSGSATFSTSALSAGTHQVVAIYSGDSNYQSASSTALTETIQKTLPLADLSISPGTTEPYNTPLTIKETLSSFGVTPTGSVDFDSDGVQIGAGTISSVTTTNYLYQSNNLSTRLQSRSRNLWYEDAPRGTAFPSISVDSGTTPPGAPVNLAAYTLALPDTSSGGVNGAIYSGLSQEIITSALAGKAATFSVWLESSTPSTITLYLADSSSSASIAIQQCNVTTVWTRCSATGTVPASSTGVIFSIRSWGVAAESVNVWGAQLEQSSTPGPFVATTTSPQSGSGVVAQLTTSSLSPGTHAITGVYSGDSDYLASTTDPTSVTITKLPVTITAVSNPNPSSYKASVTVTVTVSAPTGISTVPTGTVSVSYNGTSLGTGTLNASGVASILTSAALPVGTDQLTVTYQGDQNFY